ncbi:MFS transporter [Thorsellia anophelis]|uniref:Predicted arabinose efflux permease, MFS family n=1 Tax=Thorsellia anophelis DSM 18579 TaxID=1123402 RepID=A0A1I0E095_9GAMM|nr:MFS transporter [Thorsellia anophelis]SET37714.1 Predicted arabinose efflux permease, MFS family [Thorsellia anophelis DSM 18579]
MKNTPPIVHVLLISSLVLTIARGVTLPFVTIYLIEHFLLSQQAVGFVMGIGLAIAIVASFFGGYLVDKLNKKILAAVTVSFFSISFILFPFGDHPVIVILLIALLNTAYNVWSINQKAFFAEWLPVDKRIRVFSANYTIINIGWAIGSALGVWVVALHPLFPFYLSALLAVAVLILLFARMYRYGHGPNSDTNTSFHLNFISTLSLLKSDKRLIYFTLGSTMGAVVFGQFTGYLSQYLITITNQNFAYQAIGVMMITNALLVIILQYSLSKFFKANNLMRWLIVGSLFFVLGLVGFILAGDTLVFWAIAMAIFTLGEIIVIPVEYLFIDFIAPAHLKGTYYGVQNLSQLGGAFNPIMAGFLLTYLFPSSLFIVLISTAFIGLFFFYLGYRLAHEQNLAAQIEEKEVLT